MKSAEAADIDETLPLETVRSVLQAHPVRLAILFGSFATDTTHPRSDIDIAVEFDTLTPTDPDYNETLFGLSVSLSETLEADDVDLVDIHTLSPQVAQAVFEHGVLLVGDQSRAVELRRRITAPPTERSPRERFDAALAKINEHLATPGTPATDEAQ